VEVISCPRANWDVYLIETTVVASKGKAPCNEEYTNATTEEKLAILPEGRAEGATFVELQL
jgi:hypothetical protein